MLSAGTNNKRVMAANDRWLHRFLNDCIRACTQVAAETREAGAPSRPNVAATFQSAAKTSPHMLIDNKKGDNTILTTSRQALQNISRAGVLIGYKILIFKANTLWLTKAAGDKDRLPKHIRELTYLCVVLLASHS